MSKFRSLGVVGATGNRQIEREQIIVDQLFERNGATLKLSVEDFDAGRMPEGATVDLLIKDNQNNKRTYHTVGDIRHVDLSDIKQPLNRSLDPRRSEIFIKIVGPDGRIAAQSECVKLSGGDSGFDGLGSSTSSRSPIHTVVDPNQTVPIIGKIENDYPLVSFGPQGVSSPAEAKNDFGCVGYALFLTVEKFILALIMPGGEELTGENWDGLRTNIARTLGKPDWSAIMSENASDNPIDAAHNIAVQYYTHGELKKIVDKLSKNKASAEEIEG